VSPKIYRTDSIIDNNNFLYDVVTISNHTPPPYDIGGTGPMLLSTRGIKGLWEGFKFEFPKYMPIDVSMMAEHWKIVFPYFTKDKYKVGEMWNMNLVAPITFTTALDIQLVEKMKTFFKSKTKVVLKFESVKEMLGFQCAEISYLIADSLKSDKGEMLYFKCDGTVFFAINEGFIVSDIMNIKHDQLNSYNDVVHISIRKKLRMLSYTPYSNSK